MTEQQFLEDHTPTLLDTKPQFVEGLFTDMSFPVYRQVEALSQSGAKKILQSCQHYRFDREHPSAGTPNMQFGTSVHVGVMEPNRFDDAVVCLPEIDRRSKAGKLGYAEFLALNPGRILLSADDFDRSRRCVDAVLAHPAARKLLDGSMVEHSLFWLDKQYGVKAKARLDIRSHGGITDLKTCIDASPEGFSRSIANFGYHLQASYYISGAEHALGASPEFYCLIAVESEQPHAVAVYQLDTPSILAGAHLANIALARYAEALAAGKWPGYSDLVQTINVPRWALRQVNL